MTVTGAPELYRPSEFGTLGRRARPEYVGAAGSADDVVGSVCRLLRPPGAATLGAPVHQRTPGRQCPEVDAGDAGPGHRTPVVSGLPTLHYACALAPRGRVAPVAGGAPRSAGGVDSRRHRLSQTGASVRRSREAIRRAAEE